MGRRALAAFAAGLAASVDAHDYPPGGDCVRTRPEIPLTAAELAGFATPADVVCRQKAAPEDVIKVGCVGDSITAVGHTSGVEHHWPNQLQDILDAARGTGELKRNYSVTNLGICGTTLSDHGASPWWTSPAYAALTSAKWDIVFVSATASLCLIPSLLCCCCAGGQTTWVPLRH